MLRHILVSYLFLLNTCASAQVLTLRASLPGTLIDGLPVNAGGELFYLGGSPSTYCPPEIQQFCPNSTETIFTPGLGSLFVSTHPKHDCFENVLMSGTRSKSRAANRFMLRITVYFLSHKLTRKSIPMALTLVAGLTIRMCTKTMSQLLSRFLHGHRPHLVGCFDSSGDFLSLM